MELSVNDNVKVSGRILTRENQIIEFNEEPGVIIKMDGEFVYVKTQHGTHYVSVAQISK